MSTDPSSADGTPKNSGDDPDLYYTLEIIAELAGIDATTVVRYHEQGFLQPVRPAAGSDLLFDTESLRQLRRMEHLRATCGVNEAGLKLLLSLLQEVEQLREERRQMRR